MKSSARLRIYQDGQAEFLKRIETAFPAGNSAFVALREDNDALQRYLPLFQQELLRRHGVNVTDFFAMASSSRNSCRRCAPTWRYCCRKTCSIRDLDLLLEHVSGRIDRRPGRRKWPGCCNCPTRCATGAPIIWEVMGESVYQRVQSFSELATALYSFSAARPFTAAPAAARAARLSPALSGFFRTARADDEMRNFLIGMRSNT